MDRHQGGFTLIELLVVIAIIGVLTAVAIPQYAEYRAQGYDTQALSDLRNVAIAEEAYFIGAEGYISCQDKGCAALPGITNISDGVTIVIDATPTGFTGNSTHARGSKKIFRWDSSQGGLLP